MFVEGPHLRPKHLLWGISAGPTAWFSAALKQNISKTQAHVGKTGNRLNKQEGQAIFVNIVGSRILRIGRRPSAQDQNKENERIEQHQSILGAIGILQRGPLPVHPCSLKKGSLVICQRARLAGAISYGEHSKRSVYILRDSGLDVNFGGGNTPAAC
jgi:hypothetical protein